MSNLKDTDIDDLFRRASDKYPLRTDSADWDRMAAALENKGPEPPDGPIAPEEKRKRRFFWLFLLLPLAGAGYYSWHHAGSPVASHNATGVAASTPATGLNTTPGTSLNTTPGTSLNTTPATGQNTTRDQPSTAPSAAPATAPAGTPPSNAPGDSHTRNSRTRFLAAHSSQRSGSETGNRLNNTKLTNTSQTNTRQTNASNDGTIEDASIANRANGSDDANRANRANGSNSTSGFTVSSPATGDRLFYDLRRAPISRDYRLSVDVTAPTAKKDSAAKPKAKTKHFYAGIFGSPDLSTVKMQSVQGVGSTLGVILGYTFNGGRWAIETGAYVDRKKYYTAGEYFNTKEVRLPANSWLTDVSGICYMWELPLNVRYNFNPGAKTSWFATAGFSTYLMSHEKYAYGLEWPGSAQPYDSTMNIHKPSQYPFSIINLSAGFEQRLGKIGNLRVEPYVRLPLTGLGTGKLPIMSAGVNIGITRQLW